MRLVDGFLPANISARSLFQSPNGTKSIISYPTKSRLDPAKFNAKFLE